MGMLVVTTYCERVGNSFWSEPLNALTNAAFLLAAFVLLRRLRRERCAIAQDWDLWLLSLLIGAPGIGSFLWHTLATAWAQWLDVVPILLYISVYLLGFLQRITRLSLTVSLAWLMLFLAINLGVFLLVPGDILNGSVFYLPSLLVLAIFTRYQRALVTAAALFALAVVFRSVDRAMCPYFPLGTHFLWHLAISLTVFFTTRALIAYKPFAARES